MSRKLPVYIAIDTSGSMHGEPIQSVNVGLQAMLSALNRDPQAQASVHLSLITFDLQVKELFPLTPLVAVQIPEICCPKAGATFLGEALALVVERVGQDFVRATGNEQGDWQPLLFIMTDGSPSDTARFNEMVPQLQAAPFSRIIACAAGPKAKAEQLQRLTDTVVSLDTTDSAAFAGFFQWVSDSVGQSSDVKRRDTPLPAPPDEVQIVI